METRRAFLRMAGVSLVVAGCGGGDERDLRAPAATDVDVLNAALDLEHAAVAAYREAVPLLYGEIRPAGRRFLDQERAHARALTHAIRRLGGTPNRPGRPTTYLDALRKLADPRLRHTAGTIVAAEAQQLVVLRQALGREGVPDAFERGEEG